MIFARIIKHSIEQLKHNWFFVVWLGAQILIILRRIDTLAKS